MQQYMLHCLQQKHRLMSFLNPNPSKVVVGANNIYNVIHHTLTLSRKPRDSGSNHFRHAYRCRLRSEIQLFPLLSQNGCSQSLSLFDHWFLTRSPHERLLNGAITSVRWRLAFVLKEPIVNPLLSACQVDSSQFRLPRALKYALKYASTIGENSA